MQSRRFLKHLAVAANRVLQPFGAVIVPRSVPEAKARVDPRPAILVITVPKSGTMYLTRLFGSGLGCLDYPISAGYFPVDLASLRSLKEFARGGTIAAEHLDANAQNLRLLKKYVGKWVVHLRDPRSVILSWAHHIDRLIASDPDVLDHWWEELPADYAKRSFEERIDFVIEAFLPHVVEWTNDWLKVIDSGAYEVCLTTYDELVNNEVALVNKILKFFGIPSNQFRHPEIRKTVEVSHFRSGKTDEWRQVFTPSQLERANLKIGRGLLARFDWPTV